MYKCDNCGEIFESPMYLRETLLDEICSPPYDNGVDVACCPYCQCDDIDDAYLCNLQEMEVVSI